jgi:hypothetical protein
VPGDAKPNHVPDGIDDLPGVANSVPADLHGVPAGQHRLRHQPHALPAE